MAEIPDGASCRLLRNEAAVIVAVEGDVDEVLGWSPEQLIGRPSTAFIHPEDQPSAVAAWFDMISAAGSARTWRGRYCGGDGSWRWVEAVNENRLDDPETAAVVSTLAPVTVDDVSIEEELRAREQLLSRLSDALPVGLFQIDIEHRITFTNDRLHAIIGRGPAATVEAQFAGLLPDDASQFATALTIVLDDTAVDDLEVRVAVPPDFDATIPRVCQLSLRPLTDNTGVVSGAIGCLSDVTDSATLRRELERRATVDVLTGCMNRAATLDLLDLMLRDRAPSAGVAIIFVDLDDFKLVNDAFGHAAGDALLTEVARRMLTTVRTGDHVGRLGGDEFVVLCPNVASQSAAREIVARLETAFDDDVLIGTERVAPSASFGLAWTKRAVSADELVAQADTAMYADKVAHHAGAR